MQNFAAKVSSLAWASQKAKRDLCVTLQKKVVNLFHILIANGCSSVSASQPAKKELQTSLWKKVVATFSYFAVDGYSLVRALQWSALLVPDFDGAKIAKDHRFWLQDGAKISTVPCFVPKHRPLFSFWVLNSLVLLISLLIFSCSFDIHGFCRAYERKCHFYAICGFCFVRASKRSKNELLKLLCQRATAYFLILLQLW